MTMGKQKGSGIMNQLKQKLRVGGKLIGTHISMNDPFMTELIASLGFDYLWIDTEHTAIDYQQLQTHLLAARAGGTPAIVRVPWNDAVLAKRVLEMGPDGIVFPMVNTPEEAKRAMDACLYPPLGTRGFGPLRAVNYGAADTQAYIDNNVENLCRFVQVEHVDAVRNLPETAKNPYIDGFILGPCDLSGSIGELNRVFEPHTDALIDEAISVAHAAGKPIGLSTGAVDEPTIAHWFGKGIDFLSAGTAQQMIVDGMRALIDVMRGGKG